MEHEQWLDILRKVRTGEISAEEGERLLSESDVRAAPIPAAIGEEKLSPETTLEDPLMELGWWKNAWMVPVWAGIAILILSAWLLTWGYIHERMFWFYCSWLPLILGMLVMFLGVWSRQARWAYIRIRDENGPKVTLSVPLPIRLASWGLRTFGPRIKKLEGKHLENLPEILDALGDNHDPIAVEVDDGGDHVRVYIQ
jgi:hypothetical protein